MPPQYQIGMQVPAGRPPISAGPRPATTPLQDWGQYVQRSNGVSPPAPASTGNPTADGYQAQANAWEARSQTEPWKYGGPDAGPDTRNFYKNREAFFGGPAAGNPQAKTVYHANGTISNPPQQDPGFRVYNNVSQMPAADQADIHAFRSGVAPQQGAMMPDPSKQTPAIGVPARGQAPQVGFQSVPPTAPQSFSSHQEMRNAMLSGLSKDMQAANGAGDNAKLYELFAQRAALDNGGFQGHARYLQEKALHDAQVAKLGGGGGVGIPKTPDGLLDPNAARKIGMVETNSAAGGDAFANNVTVQNYQTLESQGKPYTIDPALVPEIIDSRAPHLKSLFATDAKGPAMSPQEILAGVKQRDPGVFDNPNGMKAKAALAMLRQLHGDTLEKDLALPANPMDYAPAPDGFIGRNAGPLGRLMLGGMGASLDNLWNWRGSVMNPAGSYVDQAKANALYNALAHPNQK